ncbi:PIG-L deacetylase family protein [Sphingomonas sp. SUN039]|uniref:PIG-L deacetylase family protein n=1 Tax=Sphingomonas sp. SUN039 TaxID=2937787 RepID=UPI0021644B69|nr:PIG-L deacetylase family protein [Sphingomonas sp. SUN039]UVO52857.1 PIG-L family deacetylase [Sphingomonas sp. SUN039]
MNRVLVIAPHADDETLGMGATIARFSAEGRAVTVAIMTGHGSEPNVLGPPSLWDGIRAEAALACKVLGVHELVFDELPAVGLDRHPTHITNRRVADLVARVAPTELYLPYYHDLHGDHGALAYAGFVATRPYQSHSVKRVAMYETPTETHLLPHSVVNAFAPTLFVDVSESIGKKTDAWNCYASQHHAGHSPRSAAAIEALATWRGAYIGVAHAEAFHVVYDAQ